MSKSDLKVPTQDQEQAVHYLRNPVTIRSHCGQLLQRLNDGQSTHFVLHPDKWKSIVDLVVQVTLKHYPHLKIPLHSRWRHFNIGKKDRLSTLAHALRSSTLLEKARVHTELVILSVLLDAGAGDSWSYLEECTQHRYTRSEGLALASFHSYMHGDFSADPTCKLRVDASKLLSIRTQDLAKIFQVTEKNLLQGLEGRCTLLHTLGESVNSNNSFFHDKRLGNFFDAMYKHAADHKFTIQAEEILNFVLLAFQNIWPSKLSIGSTKLGDVGHHSAVHGSYGTDGLVPFHKLSQWMSYSLVEPLQDAGIHVENLDGLTGLAEYRNGGLFLDGGLLTLKDPSQAEKAHAADSELITEWRALTVSLLDQLAPQVRMLLKRPDLSLGQILQGGTWTAGRELAHELRKEGGPPLRIQSDGTVF